MTNHFGNAREDIDEALSEVDTIMCSVESMRDAALRAWESISKAEDASGVLNLSEGDARAYAHTLRLIANILEGKE